MSTVKFKLFCTFPSGGVRDESLEDKIVEMNPGYKGRIIARFEAYNNEELRHARHMMANVKMFVRENSTQAGHLVPGYSIDKDKFSGLKSEVEEMAKEACEYYQREFIGRYDDIIKQDKDTFGELFNPDFYPDKSELKERFKIEIVVIED